MLSKHAIQSAAPLALLYANQNIQINFHPDSNLQDLEESLLVPLKLKADEGGDGGLDEFAEALAHASRFNVSDQYPHDEIMAIRVKELAELVQFNIKLARNTVNDQIAHLVNGIDQINQDLSKTDPPEEQIVSINPSPAVEGALFNEAADRYRETKHAHISLSIQIPRPADLTPYLSTGDPAEDAALNETIGTLGMAHVEALWDRLFVSGPANVDLLFDLKDPAAWSDLAIAFVLVQNVKNNLPDGVNASLDDVNDYLIQLGAQLGRMMASVERQRDINSRTNRVILTKTPDEDGHVLVNSDTYPAYLERGGTPEAILGAVHSGESLVSGHDLIENKDRLERQWAAVKRLRDETASMNRLSASKAHLEAGILAIIQALEVNAPVKDLYRDRLKSALKKLDTGLLDDTWNHVRTILCDVLYFETDVLMILKAIDREAALTPDADIQESATFAVVEYIAQYLTNQLSVSRVP